MEFALPLTRSMLIFLDSRCNAIFSPTSPLSGGLNGGSKKCGCRKRLRVLWCMEGGCRRSMSNGEQENTILGPRPELIEV